MAETVSGNVSPLIPVSNTETAADITIYLKYYTEVYDLLESILEETVKKNEILGNISESLDAVKEEILSGSQIELLQFDAEPEETEETKENAESETHQEIVIELLEGIDETLTALSETGESINNTVSGNSIYLEESGNTSAELLEAYTEASAQQSQNATYGLSLGIGILFLSACIAGLLISRSVFGKMR